jgi:hypothetical protein
MTPQEFSRKTTEAITANPGFQPVAGPDNVNESHQAALYFGRDPDTEARQFVLHVADTDPESTTFASETLDPSRVNPGDNGYEIDGLQIEVFQGLGAVTVPYPE